MLRCPIPVTVAAMIRYSSADIERRNDSNQDAVNENGNGAVNNRKSPWSNVKKCYGFRGDNHDMPNERIHEQAATP